MSEKPEESKQNNTIDALTIVSQNNKTVSISRHNHKSEENLILDKESNEVICTICGRVVIDMNPTMLEHGSYINESNSDNSNTSSSRMYDKGLPTVMGSIYKDFGGKLLTADVKTNFVRLRLLDKHIKLQSTSSTAKSFLLLDGVKTKLAIPEHTVEKAAYLFRKFITGQSKHARSYASMMLASLYAACKLTGTPRTMQEISTAADVKKRTILRDYRLLVESLDLSFEPYKPSEFVARICAGLGLTERTYRQAIMILSKVKQDVFYGRNPIALAAAAVYISCRHNTERINQLKIASLAGISNVSLRNMYVLLRGNVA